MCWAEDSSNRDKCPWVSDKDIATQAKLWPQSRGRCPAAFPGGLWAGRGMEMVLPARKDRGMT